MFEFLKKIWKGFERDLKSDFNFENLKVNEEDLKCISVEDYGSKQESLKKFELKTKMCSPHLSGVKRPEWHPFWRLTPIWHPFWAFNAQPGALDGVKRQKTFLTGRFSERPVMLHTWR